MIPRMADDTHNLVARQFGPGAQGYVTSSAHAQGDSLARLVALAAPRPGWRVLDVATGGGHTARAFAPHATLVVAADLTYPMLTAARADMVARGVSGVGFCQLDARHLPFAVEIFDCVTCRLAAHHFSDPLAFVREAARVLRTGGVLALADNITSGEPKVSRFVNAFEALRDPSHHWAYSLEDWETFFFSAGLTIIQREVFEKELDFVDWAARMRVGGDDLLRLRALLAQAPAAAREWLKPRADGSRMTFTLTETVVVGRKG